MEADMTTLSGTKLTDTQLIPLSGAAQRQDGAVSLPERIKGMAPQKLATSLMDRGFVREIQAKPGMPAWRRDEDGRTYALVITTLGRSHPPQMRASFPPWHAKRPYRRHIMMILYRKIQSRRHKIAQI
jgi:hypothetical protein